MKVLRYKGLELSYKNLRADGMVDEINDWIH